VCHGHTTTSSPCVKEPYTRRSRHDGHRSGEGPHHHVSFITHTATPVAVSNTRYTATQSATTGSKVLTASSSCVVVSPTRRTTYGVVTGGDSRRRLRRVLDWNAQWGLEMFTVCLLCDTQRNDSLRHVLCQQCTTNRVPHGSAWRLTGDHSILTCISCGARGGARRVCLPRHMANIFLSPCASR
jgi:hypothetical protein